MNGLQQTRSAVLLKRYDVMIDKRKTILWFTAMMIVLAFASDLLIKQIFPTYIAEVHWSVPLYFWLIYVVMIFVVPKRLDSTLLVKNLAKFKGIKMVVSLFAMLVIGFLFRKHAVVVLMDFLAFSLLLLAVESIYIISLKKNMKK